MVREWRFYVALTAFKQNNAKSAINAGRERCFFLRVWTEQKILASLPPIRLLKSMISANNGEAKLLSRRAIEWCMSEWV